MSEMVKPGMVFSAVAELLKKNDDWLEILQEIIKVEEENPGHDIDKNDSPTGVAWEAGDVPVPKEKITYLARKGIIHNIYKTNKNAAYCVAHLDVVKKAMLPYEAREKASGGIIDSVNKKDIDELFTGISGYETQKKHIRRIVRTPGVPHLALAGESGTAKSLFLMDIGKLATIDGREVNCRYITATQLTNAGFFEFLYENDFDVLAVDEADEMKSDQWGHMHTVAWDGFIEKLISGQHLRKEITTKIVLGFNDITRLPVPIRRRFKIYPFVKYTPEEFIKHTIAALTTEYRMHELLARHIAEVLVEVTTDVRESIMYAELGFTTKEEVDEWFAGEVEAGVWTVNKG